MEHGGKLRPMSLRLRGRYRRAMNSGAVRSTRLPPTARRVTVICVAGLLILGSACANQRVDTDSERARDGDDASVVELPAEIVHPRTPPNPEHFLPPLPDHDTDDDVDAAEMEASLDHGPISYRGVRRRLIRGDHGFSIGAVTVVTFHPDSASPERIIDHRYGEVRRRPIEMGGVAMHWLDVEPHPVLAWIDPTFVVTFERGAEMSDEWLEGLARSTVEAIASGQAGGVAPVNLGGENR